MLRQSDFFSPICALTSTKNLTNESLDSSERNSGGKRSCLHVAKPTAAKMLQQSNINSVVKVWTNVYSGRVVMDPWKNIAVTWTKNTNYVNKRIFPNQQSHCCNVRTNEESTFFFLPSKNCKEWWNPHSTSQVMKKKLPFLMSCIFFILSLLINLFYSLVISLCIALRLISIRTSERNWLTAPAVFLFKAGLSF